MFPNSIETYRMVLGSVCQGIDSALDAGVNRRRQWRLNRRRVLEQALGGRWRAPGGGGGRGGAFGVGGGGGLEAGEGAVGGWGEEEGNEEGGQQDNEERFEEAAEDALERAQLETGRDPRDTEQVAACALPSTH
jgi:hypothetical protein